MGKEMQPVLGVTNHYGAREIGGTVGAQPTAGPKRIITFDLDVESMADDLFPEVVIPANSKILDVYVFVDEAFTITTGSTAGYIGAEGDEDTNGIQLDDTLLEAEGVTKLATGKLLGTFNDATSYISTATTLGFDIGTLDPAGTAGKARVVISYLQAVV